jgi:hypothetical protein
MEKSVEGFKAVCAVPLNNGRYCDWRTTTPTSERKATHQLNEHFKVRHLGNPNLIGYVNTFPIINRLKLQTV